MTKNKSHSRERYETSRKEEKKRQFTRPTTLSLLRSKSYEGQVELRMAGELRERDTKEECERQFSHEIYLPKLSVGKIHEKVRKEGERDKGTCMMFFQFFSSVRQIKS
jgi:hypothetical protein